MSLKNNISNIKNFKKFNLNFGPQHPASHGVLTAASDKVYQYLNFDKISDYTDIAATV